MPETAVKTKDQIAIAAIQDILNQEDYRPEFLKDLIRACRVANQTSPSPEAIIINDKSYSVRDIREHLAKFVYMLPPEKRPAFDDDSLYDDSFLNRLSGIIDQVSGFAPEPPPANIPPDLKALVAEFDTAHQAAVSAQAKRQGWSPERFREELAKQNAITVQMHRVRNYTLSQLQLAVDNSIALENLAAALGRHPEAVKRLAKIHLQTLVDKQITAQTFRQARALIKDPVQLAAYYTAQLKQGIISDDLLSLAAADRHPQTKKNNVDAALKNIKTEAAAETETAKPAIEAAAKNLVEHPTVRKTAQTNAAAAIKQVEGDKKLKPAKAIRLAEALARHPDNPNRQERIIRSAFGATPTQAKIIRSQLAPQINQLAKSSAKPNYLAMADPDSIFNDISLHPNRFPKPLVDAVRSGRISDPGKLADAIIVSQTLNIPLEAVVLSQYGVNAQKLAAGWRFGPKFLGFIPMGRGLDPKDAAIAKLSDLAAAQKQLADSLKTPPPLLPPQIPEQFLKTSRAAARANGLSEFLDQINLFHLPSAFSYNLGRIPPLESIGNSGSAFVSGLRVQSGPINSFFNFISSAGNTVRQAPSFLTAPFRAVRGLVSHGWQNIKTWAGTKVKSGLAKTGAWLAKKGITEGAKKLGLALIGKGTAALLAQAAPVVGQIAGALMLLSTLGDIGKFIWANRKEIGFGLAGGFLLGQLLLGKLLGFLGSAAWTLGGALTGGIIGFMVGGPVGAAIGSLAGGAIGYLISTGALGSVLSGIGTWLGSAATGLSSFIGALTAPSLTAGLGGTIATAGLLGVAAAWAIQTFFIQPNINSALFVPTGPGGGPIPPISKDTTCSSISGTLYCFPVAPLSNVDQPVNCTHHTYAATDIFSNSDNAIGPTGDAHLTIVAYIGGTVIWDSTPSSNPPGGYALEIQGDDGRYYYYAHNYGNIVKKGDRVTTGQPIAVMDSTGGATYTCEHLHFGISTQPDFSVCLDGNGGLSGDCPNYQYFISPSADFQQTLGMSCQDKPQPCL